jgi:stage II sporulation protein AB (anti-sigma F factor)
MWPGLERQEGQVLEAFDALMVHALTRGATLRVQGFMSRRIMTFPRVDHQDLGREHGVLELVLPAVPRAARRARGLIQAVTATRDLSDSARHDIALAVGEALANAIQHGSPRGPSDAIGLRLTLFESGLVIQVLDHGCWGEEVLHEETPSVCGRGLMLMRQLLDGVEVSPLSGGTAVFMLKRYGPQEAGG